MRGRAFIVRLHVKTLRSQKLRMLLTHSQAASVRRPIAIENDLWRANLAANFGLKVGMVGTVKFEPASIKELVEEFFPRLGRCWSNHFSLSGEYFARQVGVLHRRLLAIVPER